MLEIICEKTAPDLITFNGLGFKSYTGKQKKTIFVCGQTHIKSCDMIPYAI